MVDAIVDVDAEDLPREEQDTDSVLSLVAMGFGRDEVLEALSAAFGNVERAVEYLSDGTQHRTKKQRAGGSSRAAAAAAADGGDGGSVSNFADPPILRSGGRVPKPALLGTARGSAALVPIVATTRQNPTIVQPLLEALSHSHASLLHLVQESPSEFMALITGTPTGTTGSVSVCLPPTTSPPPSSSSVVEMLVEDAVVPGSADDAAILKRLQELTGVAADVAWNALQASGGDENVAANLLLGE